MSRVLAPMRSEQQRGLPRRLAGLVRRRGGLLLAALVCGVMVYGVVAAFGFSEEARRVPLVLGIPATLAAVVLVVKELVSPSEAGADDTPTPPAAQSRTDDPSPDDPALGGAGAVDGERPADGQEAAAGAAPAQNRISTAAACGWVLALTATFLLLGLLVTIPLFIVVFMRVYGRERWTTVLLTTAVAFGAIYLFFIRILSVQIFGGWIRIWMGW